MPEKQSQWWDRISNVSATTASIVPIVLEGLGPITVSVLVLLLLGYISARKIKDCKIPFLRVLLIWSIFSVGFIGIVTPVQIIIEKGLNQYVGFYFLAGIVFLAIAMVTFLVAKSYEKNT